MRFCFYLSGGGKTFKRFIASHQFDYKEDLQSIHLIITDFVPENPNENFGLKSAKIVTPTDHPESKKMTGLEISNRILKECKAEKIDYIFCLGNKILRGDLLKDFENRIFNTHPSILPSFRGLKAIDQGVEAKSFLLGLTLHLIDTGVDTGTPVLQIIKHQSAFRGDYESILDLCFPAWIQLMRWLTENRVEYRDGYALVKNASYSTGTYIPNLELAEYQSA